VSLHPVASYFLFRADQADCRCAKTDAELGLDRRLGENGGVSVLASPWMMGSRPVPSRILFGPLVTNLGRNRSFTPGHTAFYKRRAAGGAGIIVIEEAAVHESDDPYERSPLATRCVDGWSEIANACRAAAPGDAPLVLAALGHAGGQGTSHWHQRPLWAPSAVPEVNTREVPKVMELDDIAEVVAGFASAAKLAKEAGCDGVEINAGQHSLVRQFMSGLTNMRADEYGSDRLRFAREVLTAVRGALAGSDAIVALRLSVDELAPWAGIVPDAGAQIAVDLSQWCDLLTVVRGSIFSVQATRPDGHEPAGFGIGLARQVTEALRAAGSTTAVVAQGSIVDPAMAEQVLADGSADAVEMTRALMADAELPLRVAAGHPEQVRPCVLCNQTCQVRDNRNPIVSCVADPLTGFETSDSSISPDRIKVALRGPVTVVGAGVAGLEAARVAALRGGAVRVVERSDRGGGVLRAAAAGAGRDRLAMLADWLEAECVRLGVQFDFGHEVTHSELARLRERGPVIIASGGTHGPLPFNVGDGAWVAQAVEVLSGSADLPSPPGPLAVWDPIGGPIAVSMAEWLRWQGREVLFITPDLLIAEKLSMTGDLAPAHNRLIGGGVQIMKDTLLRSVDATSVTVEHRWSGETSTHAVAGVIVCGHRVPDDSLDPGEAYPQAGDRVAPRSIYEAVLEGRRRAMEIGA
jgi:mycofactocin system FadH/OYE family oxidoreductase 1